MEICRIFRMFVVLAMIAGSGFSSSAQEPSKETDRALDEEIKWIKAEAEATVSIATKTEMSVNDAPSIVSVITQEEIRNSGAKSLDFGRQRVFMCGREAAIWTYM
ncbi:MAG: hypothetical protein BWK80_63465 [Desulfobacteraceae bacterium IS3]|nr:MAG: hypothetical protein BWK80_63465 [Desulfobacteraceae bacterium IS3]